MATKLYSTDKAAKQIGVSRQTLQAWIAAGRISAPKPVELGGVTIRLWTPAQIEKARKFRGTLKPGPRSKKKN
ncbi:MAG: helix-turn-helix transcriptional regulator [Candidatus Acidiferrales bacterium]